MTDVCGVLGCHETDGIEILVRPDVSPILPANAIIPTGGFPGVHQSPIRNQTKDDHGTSLLPRPRRPGQYPPSGRRRNGSVPIRRDPASPHLLHPGESPRARRVFTRCHRAPVVAGVRPDLGRLRLNVDDYRGDDQ